MLELHAPLFEMSMSLSYALDLVSPYVVDHHKRVAYIAASIAAEMGLSEADQEDVLLAGLMHDIGALSLRDRIDALSFELENPHVHAELGYRLIRTFSYFSDIAPLVRFHHYPWNNGKGSSFRGEPVPLLAHVLHLADRVAVLINMDREVLGQQEGISEKIDKGAGSLFMPEQVSSFKRLSRKECFWFDATSPTISQILSQMTNLTSVLLDKDGLFGLSKLFSKIIDFRSRFTATHSSGVAASAEALARTVGMSEQECHSMRIAGYLHDLGKLAVPAEILEKKGRLTLTEMNIVKKHPYYTYRIIDTVKNCDVIKIWASLHHECIDASGYPFHFNGAAIPLGSRIMAVADVFTALTEDRPYREGMLRDRAMAILEDMAARQALDQELISVLRCNFEEVNAIRLAAQEEESREFEEFRA